MKRLWGLRVRLIVLLVILTLVPIILFTVIFQLRVVSFMKNTLWARMQAGLEKSDSFCPRSWSSIRSCFTRSVRTRTSCWRKEARRGSTETGRGLQERFRQMCERTDGLLGISVRMPDGGGVYYDAVYDTAEESPWLEDGPYGRAELLSGKCPDREREMRTWICGKWCRGVSDLTKEETYYGPMAVWRDGETKEEP